VKEGGIRRKGIGVEKQEGGGGRRVGEASKETPSNKEMVTGIRRSSRKMISSTPSSLSSSSSYSPSLS